MSGFENPNFPQKGAPELVTDLKQFTKDQNLSNVSFILEDTWDYQVLQDSNKIQPTGAWFDLFRSAPFGIFTGYAVTGHVDTQYIRVLNAARDFNAPICPTIYIENHDHGTVTYRLGSRDRWYKAQPYMIALATCSGTVLIHNGQEWGQVEDLWEDDSKAPAQFKRVQPRPLRWWAVLQSLLVRDGQNYHVVANGEAHGDSLDGSSVACSRLQLCRQRGSILWITAHQRERVAASDQAGAHACEFVFSRNGNAKEAQKNPYWLKLYEKISYGASILFQEDMFRYFEPFTT